MAIRRTLAQFSDEIVAADLADGSVTAAKVAADVATQAELDAIDVSTAMKPHIRTTMLYPAVANIMVDGTTALSAVTTGPNSSTVASSKYGTVQSDGRMYYYTDIKGSKPIKDPRIGAHFGSQRHKCKSHQKLEQETATNGTDVYSVDGREWMRISDSAGGLTAYNGSGYQGFYVTTGSSTDATFMEIVTYANDLNYELYAGVTRNFKLSVNGGTAETNTGATSTVGTPLGGRYVDGVSIVNCVFNSTPSLGINTFKISNVTGHYLYYLAFELITQDTTSTATKSQIQIPSQNVVSYGKKITVSAATPHYNPFAFKTDGSTAWTAGNHNGTAWPIGTGSSTKIHTATSLGLAAWISTNYYYPYNGGRVVKWIDTDGVIQTSVNMMPPNARSLANSASLTNGTEKGDDSGGTTSAAVANNTYFPTFTDQAVDHSQAEVAKTFNVREFGNGAANAGPGATYADASMLNNTADDIAYVMDDGLTSLSGDDVRQTSQTGTSYPNYVAYSSDASKGFYLTFIGTGLTLTGRSATNYESVPINIVQNLPYGTHIAKIYAHSDHIKTVITIDGVVVYPATQGLIEYAGLGELTFHQPKMPPIPENAVVIADYMLMADFVKQTDAEPTQISKGVRYCSGSRDHFCDGPGAFASGVDVSPTNTQWGLRGGSTHGSTTNFWQLPFFGTTALSLVEDSSQAHTVEFNDSAATETAVDCSTSAQNDMISIAETVTIGQTNIKTTLITGGHHYMGTLVASPIHTSHHYQSFETPYLHELVGGDRNMEQTNLVVTPDGKTWDEVTRDVSYIGNIVCYMNTDTDYTWDNKVIFDEWRGNYTAITSDRHWFNKDFAIAYDRLICLKDGQYELYARTYTAGSQYLAWKVNNAFLGATAASTSTESAMSTGSVAILKRGDYIQLIGNFGQNTLAYNDAHITRL